MSFKDTMESRYSADIQSTEMYQLLLQEGIYAEATLAQEVQSVISRNVDPTAMMEDDIRKFLSFFYIPIRNFIPASGSVGIEILESSGTVVFNGGDDLLAVGGSNYKLTSSGIGVQGDSVTLQVAQYTPESVSGTYDNFIVFSAPNIIMDSITVYLNGTVVPAVTSPRNGCMAFFFGGNVYIKIFLGVNITQARGVPYSVSYNICDGVLGNIGANSFTAFSSQLLDVNLKPVSYALTNPVISNGSSSPSLGELRDLLRYWLYVRNTLTKPSDYRTWFKAQPEVGDCLAWGDTEEFMMGAELSITGMVRICLLDPTGAAVSSPNQVILNARVQAVKDVGYLSYVSPDFVEHFFTVRYTGSNDDAGFVSDALSEIQARYNLDTLRENGMSLFDALDVGLLSKVLSEHISQPRGLEIVPAYYRQDSITPSSSAYAASLPSPNNLKKGYTTYLYEVLDTEGNVTSSIAYTEFLTGLHTAAIVDQSGTQVGTHNYTSNTISITISPVASSQRMTVWGEVLNRSYIDTGAFINARQLAGVSFIKVVPTF